MASHTSVIEGAKFRADLVGVDRVVLAEWAVLERSAILSVWSLCAAARPDFQVAFADSVVVAGGSASITLPAQFSGLIDVVFGPDTTGEYSLGPYVWQNRRAPGAWLPPAGFTTSSSGASSARLMGNLIYLEPATRAGGSYRVWYCPRPKVPDFIVRLATAAALPACTSLGVGPAHTLNGNSNGALTVDGVLTALNDRILVKDQAATDDNGIYTVVQAGSAGTQWYLGRAADFDQASEIYVGATAVVAPDAGITGGTFNNNKFFEVATAPAVIDTDPITFGEAQIDAILEQFRELIEIKTALPALIRDDDLNPAPLQTQEIKLEAQLAAYFRSQRFANGPGKMVDTDARGPRAWYR